MRPRDDPGAYLWSFANFGLAIACAGFFVFQQGHGSDWPGWSKAGTLVCCVGGLALIVLALSTRRTWLSLALSTMILLAPFVVLIGWLVAFAASGETLS